MKKIIALFVAMLLCVSLMSVTALADTNAALSVGNVSGVRGEEVTVTVKLNNNPGIAGMVLTVSYDSAVLEKVSYNGTGMGGGVWTIIDNCVWDNGGDSTVNGDILYLTFKVKEDAPCGSTTVSVSCSAGNWNGERVTVSTGYGSVNVDHVWGEWTTTPATCTEEGHEERTCSKCGATESNTLLPEGHAWGEWTVVTPATCTVNGSERRDCDNCDAYETRDITANGHNPSTSWHMDENNHWHECSCGEHFDEAAHTMVDKENYLGQTYQQCSVCGYETDPVGEIPDDVPQTGDITILFTGAALVLIALTCTVAFIVKRKAV